MTVLAVILYGRPVLAEIGLEEICRQTHWGQSSDALLRQFGADTTRLRRALDFGDS